MGSLRCEIPARLMTGSGQERRIRTVCNISASPPAADVEADIPKPALSARTRHPARWLRTAEACWERFSTTLSERADLIYLAGRRMLARSVPTTVFPVNPLS
jgi:hypothetical protein